MAQVIQNVKRLQSFGDCERYYTKAHQWGSLVGYEERYSEKSGIRIEPGFRAHPPGSRALDPYNHKRYLSIRPRTNEHGDTDAYICRYRETDVVVWRRDEGQGETVTVRGYASLSTNVMAEALTPNGISFRMHYDDDYYCIAHGRVYAFSDRITFAERTGWNPVDHTYTATFIDGVAPALANALNRTRYKDFVAWLNAVLSFDRHPVSYATDRPAAQAADDYISTHGVLATLANSDAWVHLKNFTDWSDNSNPMSVYARADSIKAKLREHIYREYKAVPVRQVEWYDASQFDRQRQLRSKYPWAI